MATGFNNTGSYDPDMPLEVTAAIIPPRKGTRTLEEARALLRRTKQYMDECDERDAEAKLARGNADTMEMPAQAISSKNTLQPNADAPLPNIVTSVKRFLGSLFSPHAPSKGRA